MSVALSAVSELAAKPTFLTVDVSRISNPTLARLLSEVINDKENKVNGDYDRVHNKHNR